MDIADIVDIKLNSNWQLAQDVTGDFLKTAGKWECLMQEIQLEALTQEGDLWYDEGFGWSLMDFIHAEADELVELEIKQRVLDKLSWYEEVDISSIKVSLKTGETKWGISILFQFKGESEKQGINIALDRINAEVVIA